MVRQTLAGSSGAAADRRLLEHLRGVAARHRGASLVLDPVALDLVDTVLRHEFGADGRRAETWREVASQVAATLMDDPVCKERLQAFWLQLSEG